jgi:hypothetical protein
VRLINCDFRKTKTASATRSLTKKITSPYSKSKGSKERQTKINSATQTAREMARTSRKEKSNDRNTSKKSCFSSSKISSWVEEMNNNAGSEMNSNIYRNVENSQQNHTRNKSSRSHVSTKKKRKKHYSSIGQSLEKHKTVDNTKPPNFTNQLISLIQKIHSPKGAKVSHNHSHSEVQSNAVKRMVQPKNRHSYKVVKKQANHVRSNTTENGGTTLSDPFINHIPSLLETIMFTFRYDESLLIFDGIGKKHRRKINQFQDYSNAFKSVNQPASLAMDSSTLIENDSRLANRLTLDNNF